MTDLKELLMDIADQAPQTEMAAPALRTARRRRAQKLAAAPAGLLVVAALAMGGVTAFQRATPEPAGPAEHLGVLNAHVPSALPDRGVGPARLAYQDYCRTESGAAAGKGACGQWRVLTTDGHQYRVPGSLGPFTGSGNPGSLTDLEATRLFAVSADGGRIMYYQKAAQRVVVRDLATGDVRTVAHLPLSTVRSTPVEFALSGNGTWAGIELGTVSDSGTNGRTPEPRLVEVSTGTTTRLPRQTVFTSITDAGTAYMWRTTGKGGTQRYDHDGRRIGEPIHGNGETLSPDHFRTARVGKDGRTVVVSDATTGKVVGERTPPRSVPEGYYDVVSWPSPSSAVLAGPDIREKDHNDAEPGAFGYYALNPRTGRVGAHGTFTLKGKQVQVIYGALGR